MTIPAPYNKTEIELFVEEEKKAQAKMDAWYKNRGFEIVSRVGDTERDLVLKRISDGSLLKVEEKYRSNDYGDLAVEILQCMINIKLGWFYTEKPDRLSYIIRDKNDDPYVVYWIKFTEFRTWFFEYLKKSLHPKAFISIKGMGLTLNLCVPWKIIPNTICRRFIL